MNYNDTILDLELLTLSQQERQHLIKVIERDERLRRLQNEKIKHLRETIANIEINSLNIPKEDIQNASNCILCSSRFTFLINTGVFCAVCGYKVCKSCKVEQYINGEFCWYCKLCHMKKELMKETGEWMFLQKNEQIATNKSNVSIDQNKRDCIYGSKLLALSLFPNNKNLIMSNLMFQVSNSKIQKTQSLGRSTNKPGPLNSSLSIKRIFDSRNENYIDDFNSLTSSEIDEKKSWTRLQEEQSKPEESSRIDSRQVTPRITLNSDTETLNVDEAFIEGRTNKLDDTTSIENEYFRQFLQSNEDKMSNFDDNSFDLKSEFHSDVFTSSPNNTLILKKSADKDNTTLATAGYDIQVENKGNITLQLKYNKKASILSIYVKNCTELLKPHDKIQSLNPYVKLYLISDSYKQNKQKTKIKKNTSNPEFNEEINYKIQPQKLDTTVLLVSVWHHDPLGHNVFIGELKIQLYQQNLNEFYESSTATYTLTSNILTDRMMLSVKLDYKSENKTFSVFIMNAKNLSFNNKKKSLLNTYVQACLLPNKAKQKSKIIKNTTNPFYEALFSWTNLTLNDLADRSLLLTIWSNDFLSSSTLIGSVKLDTKSSNEKINKLWKEFSANGKSISIELDLK